MIDLIHNKHSLTLRNPIMLAAGVAGFGLEYARTIDFEQLGAIVTNPITWRPRRAANGIRVVVRDGGVLVHTGLANPGLPAVIKAAAHGWARCACPVIVHLAAENPDDVARCLGTLNGIAGLGAIELGAIDSVSPHELNTLVTAARQQTELPLIVRLPLYTAPLLASAAVNAGAEALTIAAPPRGTARDPLSGELIGGRLYGPWLQPLALRTIGQLAREVAVPVIGCGGVHSADDARAFLEAGARAVQLDSLVWVRPDLVDGLVREMAGLQATRAIGALADEWQVAPTQPALQRPPIFAPPP